MNLIGQFYQKCEFFDGIKSDLDQLLEPPYETVGELNLQTTLWGLCRLTGQPYNGPVSIDEVNQWLIRETRFSLEHIALGSTLSLPAESTPTERILHLCQTTGCSDYIAGGTAIDSYFEIDKFSAAGVSVHRQEWNCKPYPQTSKVFIANLSIIDLLANCSSESAMEIVNSHFTLELA